MHREISTGPTTMKAGWKRRALVAVLVGLASVGATAQDKFIAAARQSNIFSQDAAPFQLEVDFQARQKALTPAHVLWKWESKERWWRRITLGDLQITEIQKGDTTYTNSNGAFTPERVREMLGLLRVAGAPDPAKVKREKLRSEHGKEVATAEVLTKQANYSTTFRYSFLPNSLDVLSLEWKDALGRLRTHEFQEYAEFHGHRYPRKMQQLVDGQVVVSAVVTSLTSAPLPEAFLEPAPGSIVRRYCEGMKDAERLRTPNPEYPEKSRRRGESGLEHVAMTVMADGSVEDIHLREGAPGELAEATRKTLMTWKFKPAMCGAEPVVSDVEIIVNFRVR